MIVLEIELQESDEAHHITKYKMRALAPLEIEKEMHALRSQSLAGFNGGAADPRSNHPAVWQVYQPDLQKDLL